MIERYLVKGIRLRWQLPVADTVGAKDGSIVDNPVRVSTMRYDGVDGKIVTLASAPNVRQIGFQQMGQQIPHGWLTYKHGHTTRIRRTTDILTGPMSGCWIVRWTDTNGAKWVGHIGTVESSVVVSQAAKAGFRNGMQGFPKVRGYNPANAWTRDEIADEMTKLLGVPTHPPSSKIISLVTSNGRFYSIVMFRLGYGDEYVVGGIRRVRGTSKQQLGVLLA
jgi:hypothetical protein